jgi:hypothetical protein
MTNTRLVLGGVMWKCPLAAWNGLAGATASDTQYPLYVPEKSAETADAPKMKPMGANGSTLKKAPT